MCLYIVLIIYVTGENQRCLTFSLQGEEEDSDSESTSDAENEEEKEGDTDTEKDSLQKNNNQGDIVKKKLSETFDEDNTSDEEVFNLHNDTMPAH